MNDLPRLARLYIFLICGLGLAAVIASLLALTLGQSAVLTIVALALVIALLDIYPVTLYVYQTSGGVEVTISVAAKMAAILLLPPPIVILSVFAGTLFSELWLKRVWYRLLFNVGMMTVNFAVVAVVYNQLHDPTVSILGSVQNVVALAAMGASDIVLNSILVALVIALATQSPVHSVWAQNSRPLLLQDLSMLPIAVFLYILWDYTPWAVLLALVPLIVMRRSYQLVADLRRQTREALFALARVLDERDEETSRHSELVAENAGLIARELNLGPEEVDTIMRAAALHDIGKVGLRNEILFKPGGLTREERELAKRHAALGGELLKRFPLFEKGAIYVRHHHERWDGTGYPDGLRGEAIPLGARILAVADSYQAMVEDRPYRQALSKQFAFEQLIAGAGTQFDPAVVAAFLRAQGVMVPKAMLESVSGSQEVIPVMDTAKQVGAPSATP
ncbi:MAG TPA: HD-GYP domain-containing protein [Anaerolineae bacterium]|nr:HD-GYP domain-containing protein [Anaerolineae bacterium]